MNFNSVNYSILNSLRSTELKMNKIMQQLTTGKRINSAADDAAGLSMSTRLKSQISGHETANQNIKVARSFLETADGAASRASDILMQMKDLAEQANNGTLSTTDAANLQTEFDLLRTTYNDLVSNTKFNGKALLNDATTAYSVNTGFSNISLTGINITATGASGVGDLSALNISTQSGANTAFTTIETAIDTLSDRRASLGSKMNVLDFREELNTNYVTNLETTRSRIEDADMAMAASEMTKFQLVQQSNLQLLQQSDMFYTNLLMLLQG